MNFYHLALNPVPIQKLLQTRPTFLTQLLDGQACWFIVWFLLSFPYSSEQKNKGAAQAHQSALECEKAPAIQRFFSLEDHCLTTQGPVATELGQIETRSSNDSCSQEPAKIMRD